MTRALFNSGKRTWDSVTRTITSLPLPAQPLRSESRPKDMQPRTPPTFIDDPRGSVKRIRFHPRKGVPERELVDGVTGVEPLRLFRGVEVNMSPLSHHPFARSHVEISGHLDG